MHIFFSGIGGAAIGPLALIARQAGYQVSGSDKQTSNYTDQLQKQGIELYIGQSRKNIVAFHARKPIDWLVYSSALSFDDPNHPELEFARARGIKHTKRDELLNEIIESNRLKLLAVAGTHGKSTTTAMIIWLFNQLNINISYSVGAKIPFGPMGQFLPGTDFFIYECDEFDRNFLAFHPYLSLITGIGWDHQEVFPTRGDYNQAFTDFIGQSKWTILWRRDGNQLALNPSDHVTVLEEDDPHIARISLFGPKNREDAWAAIRTVHELTDTPVDELIARIGRFPGLKQRMERLAPGLYTNYAHTAEKISGGMSTALEIAASIKQNVVVIYEPLTNRRQYAVRNDYKNCFKGAKQLYWLPTYLAREDPDLPILQPQELIRHLKDPSIAQVANLDENLLQIINRHLQEGDMVVAIGASGAGSLDEWLRVNFK